MVCKEYYPYKEKLKEIAKFLHENLELAEQLGYTLEESEEYLEFMFEAFYQFAHSDRSEKYRKENCALIKEDIKDLILWQGTEPKESRFIFLSQNSNEMVFASEKYFVELIKDSLNLMQQCEG